MKVALFNVHKHFDSMFANTFIEYEKFILIFTNLLFIMQK